ncbi:ABC transporter permease subunit [Mediterraneibacter glycyrrhizinilyticus]|uniref:ABC transporter permease subunit n=1 Tax=Mediterraneibacter glycyrrhizinilyticus TaxID=342942 RepID=UPI002657E43C|nr:ABC transporter permease subunit [Mediterraneibacter glycyrrhizinilyticus]MCF2569208.1 ABC transporter permease subunit [Mediterraneibacter glycyrrhizinilyticus]
MSRLLSADFAKLKKNKFFWICMPGMFLFGIFTAVMHYITMQQYGENEADITNILFIYALTVVFLIPAFVSLFVGTEYSDGTIRNKMIIGHTRAGIYLSDLIVCSVAGIGFCVSYIIGALLAALPLYTIDAGILEGVTKLVLCSFIMSVAFTALCILTAMLCQNKALTAVINILAACFLLVISLYVLNKLSEPEVYPGYSVMTDSGEVEVMENEPNPDYLRGTEREVYQFLNDFLPTGQAINITQRGAFSQSPGLLAAYSASIIIVSTGIGVFAFKKRDVK